MTRKTPAQARIPLVAAVLTVLFAALVTICSAPTAQAQQSNAVYPSADRQNATHAATLNAESAAESPAHTKKTPGEGAPQSVSFLPAVTYVSGNPGTSPGSLAIADVNNDGKPDLIVVNVGYGVGGGTNSVGVMLGNGDGTFQAPILNTSLSQPGESNALAVADVNGDGKPDLIVAACCATNGDFEAAVMLGNGNGTFKSPVLYDLGGNQVVSIAAADVNGDGTPDIVSANWGNASKEATVTVLLGNGDGTFQPPIASAAPVDPGCLTIADVNNDGIPDALICSENTVAVLLGNGNGTFQSFSNTNYSTGFCTPAVAVGDFSGDGFLDMAAPNLGPDYCAFGGLAAVLLGNGNGTFQPEVEYPANSNAGVGGVAVADVNGDGKLDLLVTSGLYGPGLVSVLLGIGDGTFQAPTTFSTDGTYTTAIVTADLNGDGKPDIVVANYFSSTVSVLINNSCTGNCSTTTLTSSLNPSTYGQPVTFTATVTGIGSVPPTGTVVFQWNDRGETLSLGSATLNSSGIATLTKSNLNADTYPVTAVYKGDASNLGSSSAVLNQAVFQTTSTATLTSSPNPSTVGEAVKFTATISSPTVKATGPVTFTAGQTVLGTAQIGWNGEATISISSLPVGSTTVTATYNGDSNIKGSSASVTQVVTQSPSQLQSNARHAHPEVGCSTQTTLTSSGSPSPVGAVVTFTATVNAPSFCQGINQYCNSLGSVAFYDIDNLMGTAPIGNNCTAVLQPQLFHLGNNRIKAQYQGSDFDLPSSAVITQVVNAYPTATTLSSSLNPSIYGQSLTWTATVTSPDTYYQPPTGQVAFMAYGEAIGHATLNSSTGVATFTSSVEYANSYPLTAVYKGDAYNQSSTSSVLNQVINPTTTTATLTSSPNPSISGESVTFKAVINSPTTSPTGPVTFTAGNIVLGQVQLKGRIAELTTSSLPVGSTTVTATYNGDSNIKGSSASVTQVVTQ
jgi:hypothetical protein